MMVRLEFDRNADALRVAWSRIPARGKPVTIEESHESRNLREWAETIHQAIAWVDHPPTACTRDAWISQLGIVPRALPSDEIAGIAAFYESIDRLLAIRHELQAAIAVDREDRRAMGGEFPVGVGYLPVINQRASQLWRGAERIAIGALEGADELRSRRKELATAASAFPRSYIADLVIRRGRAPE